MKLVQRMTVVFVLLVTATGWSGSARGAQAVDGPPRVDLASVQPAEPASFAERFGAARDQLAIDSAAGLQALDALAVESTQTRLTRPLDETERAQHRELYLTLARGHLQMLDNDRASDAFREFIKLDPTFAVDSLAPLEQELVNGLRSRESGFLELQGLGPGVRVLANGVPIGLTTAEPFRVMLLAGDYDIRVEQDGYEPAEGRTSVGIGRVTTLGELTPRLVVPPIALVTSVADIPVYVGEQLIGQTVSLTVARAELDPQQAAALDRAVALTGFSSGSVGALVLRAPPLDRAIEFRFRRECFVEATRTIAITTEIARQLGQREPLLWFGDASAVRMEPNVGTLRVTSTPDGADVYFDEQLVGKAPLEREVCAGTRQVRVQHQIGAYSTVVSVLRDRLETIDAVIKPSVAVIGGVETVDQVLRASRDLGFRLEQALQAVTSTFQRVDLRPVTLEADRWTTLSTARLVAAADRGDDAEVVRLLALARQNFDAPLLLAAVQRTAGSSEEQAPIDILAFWVDHAGVDRLRWRPLEEPDARKILGSIDDPVDLASLVYRNSAGLRAIDTSLPNVPLIIAQVDEGSPAASAGVQVGDAVEAVDGRVMSAAQLEERIQQGREGDVVEFRIARGTAPASTVSVGVRREPRAAPVFDRTLFGNALMAKLTAARLMAGSRPERDLVTFSLALVQMRYGAWQAALDLLEGLGAVPVGLGVGPGSAAYYRARCHEALGDVASAQRLYQEALSFASEILGEDGTSVAVAAGRRMALLPAASGQP